jgi:hypothetical protein
VSANLNQPIIADEVPTRHARTLAAAKLLAQRAEALANALQATGGQWSTNALYDGLELLDVFEFVFPEADIEAAIENTCDALDIEPDGFWRRDDNGFAERTRLAVPLTAEMLGRGL